MLHRPVLLTLFPLVFLARAQSISVQVSGIPATATKIVAVVDQGSLSVPLRAAQTIAPGTSSTTFQIGVAAGGPYRVRALAFQAGSAWPAILRSGKVNGINTVAGSTTAAPLAFSAPTVSTDAANPISGNPGSAVVLGASVSDPGDACGEISSAAISGGTLSFAANFAGTFIPGSLTRLAEGSYHASTSLLLPNSSTVFYYQFALAALAFNDPSGTESPQIYYPNVEAAQSLLQVAVTLSSGIQVTVNAIPATATKIVAVVDQGTLASTIRAARTIPAGTSSTTLSLTAPAGGPYRVRAIAFVTGASFPAILRSGKAGNLNIASNTQVPATIALGNSSASLDAATPTWAPPFSDANLVANIQDPGDASGEILSAALRANPSSFSSNQGGLYNPGDLVRLAEGSYQVTATVTMPGAGQSLYYQFALPALPFRDPATAEAPQFYFPNLEAGQSLGQILSTTTPPCNYTLSKNSDSGTAQGWTGSVTVTVNSGCAWTASSGASWVQITAGASGSGSGAVSYQVLPNTTASPRSVNITAAGKTLSITQAAMASISVNRTSLRFTATNSGAIVTPAQDVTVSIAGNSAINWTVTSSQPWVVVNPAAGVGPGRFSVSVVSTSLPVSAGLSGTLTLNAPATTGTPITVNWTTVVAASGTTAPPFGAFDTPVDGATGLSSSVAVTGWALDDLGVGKVQIYRDPVGAEAAGTLVYIGDAVFVSDSRTDIAAGYPSYPLSYRAGWGYMMLTNFLPAAMGGSMGNGQYKLYAVATDVEGKQSTLGSKVITVNNTSAVKPFGSIATPAQGGTASGTAFNNVGWTLTPPPAMIATNGSTIRVMVDGVSRGNPTYNMYRADIANLFPGYANSSGAGGSFLLDTTQFGNGMHSISWVVTDNQGHADGIGSRYFFVLNGSAGAASPLALAPLDSEGNLTGPPAVLSFRRGLDARRALKPLPEPSADGSSIEVDQLDFVELHLPAAPSGSVWSGHQSVAGAWSDLPAGSSFDPTRGIFRWQLAPGWLGEVTLEFSAAIDERPAPLLRVPIRIVPQSGATRQPEPGKPDGGIPEADTAAPPRP